MTWFDALLVTLWAVVTALGIRRGMAGLLWGLGGLLACLATNVLTGNALTAAALAALSAVGVSLLIGRLLPAPVEHAGHLAAGALGGFALGGALVAALALGFPLDMRVTPQGRAATYPSASLPPALYDAVSGSAVKNALSGVWSGPDAVRILVVPDQVQH